MELQFTSFDLLKKYLISEKNFMELNLDEGFELFENEILASEGSTNYEELQTNKFYWKTNDGEEISVDVAFVYDEEDDTDEYVIII